MSDAMAELRKLGDQATLGALDATDLYIMRYLTMTEDSKLLKKMLEKELPTQQQLIDIVWCLENISCNRKTLSTATASAVEAEAKANYVGKGQGRGRGRSNQGKAVKKKWEKQIYLILRNKLKSFWLGTVPVYFAVSVAARETPKKYMDAPLKRQRVISANVGEASGADLLRQTCSRPAAD
jgi:hypothetical protein